MTTWNRWVWLDLTDWRIGIAWDRALAEVQIGPVQAGVSRFKHAKIVQPRTEDGS